MQINLAPHLRSTNRKKNIVSKMKVFQRASNRFYSTISVGLKENYGRIAFNRPEKYNCINIDTFQEIPLALRKLDEDESVKFVALTGEGKFYSAGNDINNFSYIYGRFETNKFYFPKRL